MLYIPVDIVYTVVLATIKNLDITNETGIAFKNITI